MLIVHIWSCKLWGSKDSGKKANNHIVDAWVQLFWSVSRMKTRAECVYKPSTLLLMFTHFASFYGYVSMLSPRAARQLYVIANKEWDMFTERVLIVQTSTRVFLVFPVLSPLKPVILKRSKVDVFRDRLIKSSMAKVNCKRAPKRKTNGPEANIHGGS